MVSIDVMLRVIKEHLEELPVTSLYRMGACYEVPCSFDTETYSFYDDMEQKCALVYAWMFGFCNVVCMGRSIWDFQVFIDALNEVLGSVTRVTKPSLVVWVHNMIYDFQFIRKLFNFDKSFLLDSREIAYARTGRVIFRDSLIMSGGRPLALIGKELEHHDVQKMVGDLDYSVARTPLTPLSETELKYCENDIRVLQAYIYEKIEMDGALRRIPLTNTGYVRRDLSKSCHANWRQYSSLIDDLTITPDCYHALRLAQMGGFTHASRQKVGKVLEDVGSYDITSSYPTVMILEEFPISMGRLIDEQYANEHLDELLERYCCCFEIDWYNVTPKLGYEFIISQSKCNPLSLVGAVITNGRIMCASHLETYVTEHDYRAYHRFYEVEDEHVRNFYIFDKGHLPQEIVLPIIDYYWKKTALKGVKGQEREYMISKNMINSVYGCTCMNPVRDEYSYDNALGFLRNGIPVSDMKNRRDIDVVGAIEEYNNSMSRFLYFPWGVWVTALARRNLFEMIEAVGNDYVYADTDSVKLINWRKHEKQFEAYNERIYEKISAAAKYYGFKPDRLSPCSPDGGQHTIGLYDFEGVYKRFKTLGAKRYLVETDDGIALTVAGLNKKMGCEYLKSTGHPFEAFTDELVIPADKSGRTIATYIDEQRVGRVKDYLGKEYHYLIPSCVHMEPSEYHLSMDTDLRNMVLQVTGILHVEG